MTIIDSIRLSCRVARVRAKVQLSESAFHTWLTSINESTYDSALKRMSFPRLPLTFPTLLHELNLISIIAILDHEALRDAYSAVATIAEGSYDDVIIRGVMACYISSSEDSWESKSNLLGAAGMGLSDEKVSEMFNLPLSLMTEKDHPSLPGIKIGERSEGRHAGLVKSIGRNLRSVSRSLVKEGYTCMGEVVERAFSEAEEMNMAPQDYVGNTLLTIAPCLGETYEIQGTTVNLHAPLLRLFHNILTLLSRSKTNFSPQMLQDALRSPAASNLAAGLSALRLGFFDFSSTVTEEGVELRDCARSDSTVKLSPQAVHLLRACTVDACEQMGPTSEWKVDENWKCEISPVGISATLEGMARKMVTAT